MYAVCLAAAKLAKDLRLVSSRVGQLGLFWAWPSTVKSGDCMINFYVAKITDQNVWPRPNSEHRSAHNVWPV